MPLAWMHVMKKWRQHHQTGVKVDTAKPQKMRVTKEYSEKRSVSKHHQEIRTDIFYLSFYSIVSFLAFRLPFLINLSLWELEFETLNLKLQAQCHASCHAHIFLLLTLLLCNICRSKQMANLKLAGTADIHHFGFGTTHNNNSTNNNMTIYKAL